MLHRIRHLRNRKKRGIIYVNEDGSVTLRAEEQNNLEILRPAD